MTMFLFKENDLCASGYLYNPFTTLENPIIRSDLVV